MKTPRLALFLVAVVAIAAACDRRERAIQSHLSDAELLLFDRGKRLSSPCWACHDFYGTQNKIGPHLSEIYGRRAGASSFPAYSPALKGWGGVWNEATLRSYLTSPQNFVPGTTMVSPGVGSADVDALLFYMRHVTAAQP